MDFTKRIIITVANVADKVPVSLRGPSYQLYLVEQRKYWNDRPLYIIDEWVAYTNDQKEQL